METRVAKRRGWSKETLGQSIPGRTGEQLRNRTGTHRRAWRQWPAQGLGRPRAGGSGGEGQRPGLEVGFILMAKKFQFQL